MKQLALDEILDIDHYAVVRDEYRARRAAASETT